MIPSLTELTASLSSPTSAIAPRELVGTSPFPALLDVSQAGLAKGNAPENRKIASFDPVPDGAEQAPQPGLLAMELETGQTDQILPKSDLAASVSFSRAPILDVAGGLELRSDRGLAESKGGRSLPVDGIGLPSGVETLVRGASFAPLGAVSHRPDEMPDQRASATGADLPHQPDATVLQASGTSYRHDGNSAGGNPAGQVVERDTAHLPKHSPGPDLAPKSVIPDGREVSRSLPKAGFGAEPDSPPQPETTRSPIGPAGSIQPNIATAGAPPPPAPSVQVNGEGPEQTSPVPAAPIPASAITASSITAFGGQALPNPAALADAPPKQIAGKSKLEPVKSHAADQVLVSRPLVNLDKGTKTQSQANSEDAEAPSDPRIAPRAHATGKHHETSRPASGISDPPAASQSGAQNGSPAAAPPSPPAQIYQVASQPLHSAPSPLAQTLSDGRADIRPGQAVASTVDQLIDAREVGRSARPELVVRHQEFGSINMRIEASGGDLRATLTSRDPGFVPAVHAALADKAAAASDGPLTHSNTGRNGDQPGGQSGSTQGNYSGSGGASQGNYGSSTGSDEAPSQPYREQSGGNEEQRATAGPTGSPDRGIGNARDTGLFA